MIKKIFCAVFLVLFLLCLAQIRRYEPKIVKNFKDGQGLVSVAASDRVDVVIDPGHGGMDGGTSSGGILEKHWALRFGSELALELRSRGKGVVMTREEDEAVSLERRCRIANGSGAKVFVSVHFNYSHQPAVSGFETYFSWPKSLSATADLRRSMGAEEGVPLSDARGELLARAIQKSVVEGTGIRDRGARNSQFWVTRNISLPAVLLECGFLSNDEEREAYGNYRYRHRVICAIADALEEYLVRESDSRMPGDESDQALP